MIDNAVKDRPLYSSHIFMFPFRFDYANESIVSNDAQSIHEYVFYYNNDIDTRMNLDNIKEKLEKENWRYEPYSVTKNCEDMHLAYNEFAYFYDYAKDSLYNREKFSESGISSFFRKQSYEGEIYSIDVLDTKDGTVIGNTTYELEIQGVSLRIFHTGIAILSIELENHRYKDFKDILRINDYGRRVYPQYIGTDEDKSFATKKSFLPNSIRIGSDDPENFKAFSYEDIEIGSHIMQVLGKNLFADKKSLINTKKYDRFYIQPSLDDRMFVMSWYGNDDISGEMTGCYNYKQSDDWYKYVFVDGGDWATVQNEMMKKELLKESTYDRWSGYGTLFGMTRYSFVLFSSSLPTLKENNADMVVKHMNTMYFQMATLLLANRTSILRFSDEIAALVSPPKVVDTIKHTKKLEKLYSIYLKYYNRLYFKEVTHQDQGIELYDIGIKQMRIGEHVDKLDGKFEKLFNFENLKAEKKSASKMNLLTFLGFIFLLPSLMISLLGLDDVKDVFSKPYWNWIAFSVVLGVILAFIINKGGKNE